MDSNEIIERVRALFTEIDDHLVVELIRYFESVLNREIVSSVMNVTDLKTDLRDLAILTIVDETLRNQSCNIGEYLQVAERMKYQFGYKEKVDELRCG